MDSYSGNAPQGLQGTVPSTRAGTPAAPLMTVPVQLGSFAPAVTNPVTSTVELVRVNPVGWMLATRHRFVSGITFSPLPSNAAALSRVAGAGAS